MSQAAAVVLTPEEESTLRQWARAGTSEHRLVERAKVILLLSKGKGNLEIAGELKTRPARVSKWRQRFARHRLDGLRDADRKGRPSTYDQATDKRVLTLLDERPPEGYGTWSGPLVARAALAGAVAFQDRAQGHPSDAGQLALAPLVGGRERLPGGG